MNGQLVIESMRHLAAKYRTTFGRPPKGFVLGLKDYRVMKHEIEAMEGRTREDGIARFEGLPVHIKISSGIELLMDEDAATRVLMSSQEDRLKMVQGGIVT